MSICYDLYGHCMARGAPTEVHVFKSTSQGPCELDISQNLIAHLGRWVYPYFQMFLNYLSCWLEVKYFVSTKALIVKIKDLIWFYP